MRRISKVLCLLCAFCLLLSACGKNKYADSKYTGTWNAVSAEYMGVELSQDEIGTFVMTLEIDGSAVMEDAEGPQSGKWEEIEGGIRLDGDDDLIMKDTDGKLVLNMDGVAFTFEKQ